MDSKEDLAKNERTAPLRFILFLAVCIPAFLCIGLLPGLGFTLLTNSRIQPHAGWETIVTIAGVGIGFLWLWFTKVVGPLITEPVDRLHPPLHLFKFRHPSLALALAGALIALAGTALFLHPGSKSAEAWQPFIFGGLIHSIGSLGIEASRRARKILSAFRSR